MHSIYLRVLYNIVLCTNMCIIAVCSHIDGLTVVYFTTLTTYTTYTHGPHIIFSSHVKDILWTKEFDTPGFIAQTKK